MDLPSGLDSLPVRQAYFRDRRRYLGRRLTAVWVVLGAVVSWLFIVGFTAVGH